MPNRQSPHPFRDVLVSGLAILVLMALPLSCTREPKSDSPSAEEGTQVSEYETPAETAEPPAAPPERPRRSYDSPARTPVATPPPAPQRVTVTVPEGTTLKVKIEDALDSATSQPGDHFSATLVDPVIVGERVALAAGTSIEGTVTDVIPAKKGMKESGGSVTLSFDRVKLPTGESAPMSASISQVAKSTKKKAGTIAGGAAGGALLGKILGGSSKDAAVGAVVGGAIGTGIAAGTKGSEMKIEAGTEMSISLQQPLTVHLKP